MTAHPHIQTLRVLVTSPDGNLTHPFKSDDTVGTVHKFSYEHLVKDKTSVPLSSTWMEFKAAPVADSEVLAVLSPGDAKPENKVDLTLALAWQTQGG